MTGTFTQELSFGPWASGMMVDGASAYRTIQPSDSGGSSGIGGNDLLLIILGQSNVGAQGTGYGPITASTLPAMLALTAGTDSDVKVWNTGPSAAINAWQNYQIGVNSNPVQSSPQTTVTAMSWLGGTVTLTATAHGITGSPPAITVTGVTPAAYNGVYSGTIVDANTITYALAANPGAVTVQGKVQTQEFWGAEAQMIAFYRTKYPTKKIALFKTGPGGSQLYDDASTASWNSRATVATTKWYNTFKVWYASAIAAAGAASVNVTTATKVVCWRQGETDAIASAGSSIKADAYETNLTNLFADIDSQVAVMDYYMVHQLFGTASGNPASLVSAYPYCQPIRAAAATVCTALGSRGILVDDSPAWTTANGSNIHYPITSVDGAAGTGARMYAPFALPDVYTAGSISGTAAFGATLTYTPATWNYTPTTVAYQWNADGAAIGGATALTFVPTSAEIGKVITVTETVTARLGSTSATCTATAAITGPTLGTISLSPSSISTSGSSTVNIIGATSSSTLTVASGSLPTGMTLNSGARTITGTCTGTTQTFTLRETLTGATNTPHDTSVTLTVSAYDAAAEAYFAAMTVQPDATRKGLINDLIVGVKADGDWTGLDWLLLDAAHDSQAALLNAKDPTKSATLNGSLLFTTDRGHGGSAAVGHLTMGTPSVDGLNMSSSSAMMYAYINTSTSGNVANTNTIIGHSGSTNVYVRPRFTGDLVSARICDGTTLINTANTDRYGGCAGTRQSGTIAAYHNTSSSSTAAGTNSLPAGSMQSHKLGGNAATPQDRLAAIAYGGGSVDPTRLHGRVLTFLTAIGAN
jgi:hypothetical protein